MYFLVASGLSLIYGLMGVLNFAHGAFITVGAYAAWWMAGQVGGGAGTQLVVGGAFGLVAGAVLAVGNSFGGWLGTRLQITRGEGVVRVVFAVAVVAMAVKLVVG